MDFYNYTDSKGTIVVTAISDSYKGYISDLEGQKADMYIGEAGKGFTATAEDFKNKDIFLTNTLAGNTNKDSEYYNAKKEFIQNSAAIKDSEISFFEGLSSSIDRDISEAKGAVTGFATGAKDTIVGIYEFAKNPIDNTKELINSTIEAAKNPVQTVKNVSESMDQGLEKYNTTIDLYKMQKDEGAEAEYKANIAGQIVGAGGVGAAGKKGAEATVDAVKKAQQVAKEAEIAENLRKKQSIENNANTENPSFMDSAVRDFKPGTTHRAENINAGQVTDRDRLPRIDGDKYTADNILAENMGQDKLTPEQRWSSQRPAWKNGTLVTDHVLTEPRKFTMVIDQAAYEKLLSDQLTLSEKSKALGGWATDTPINSISDMRNLLAVPQEWKSGKLYTIEFTAKPGVQVREGIVGDMWSTNTKERLPGGGHQVEFKTHPGSNPQLFEIDELSIKEIK